MLSILAFLLQAAPAAAPAPWTVTPRPNADPTVTSTVLSAPSADANAKLILRCDVSPKGKFVSIQMFSRTPLGGIARPVSLTFDGATPLIDNWQFAERAAYVSDDAAVTTLAQAIATAKSIKVHTTNAAGEGVDAIFTGPPSDAPVKTLLAGCEYQLGVLPVRPVESNKKSK